MAERATGNNINTSFEQLSTESLEAQIAKMINRQLLNTNTKVTQQITLLQESAGEIKDYAKEELDKVREEM